jgi:hypothetical protein
MKNEFLGFPAEGSAFSPVLVITNDQGTPKDPAVNPTYRIYESGNLLQNGTGSLTKADTHNIVGATQTTPIQITSATPHKLKTGNRVSISGVGGNAAANGDFTVTYVSDTIYTLNASAGDGVYTSGGVGHVTGLYQLSLTVGSPQGFATDKTYTVLVNWTDSAARAMSASFCVV